LELGAEDNYDCHSKLVLHSLTNNQPVPVIRQTNECWVNRYLLITVY